MSMCCWPSVPLGACGDGFGDQPLLVLEVVGLHLVSSVADVTVGDVSSFARQPATERGRQAGQVNGAEKHTLWLVT
jgi:hypothetical protein